MYIIELLSEMMYKVYKSSRSQPTRLYDEPSADFFDGIDDSKISCAKHIFCVKMDSCNRGKCKSKRNKK